MKKLLLPFLISIAALLIFLQFQSPQESAIVEEEQQGVCVSPIAAYEDEGRIPLRNFVLQGMGDLRGKTVLDIGAGPGFFAFEMAQSAKKVIATELDQQFLKYMKDKKTQLKLKNVEVIEALETHKEFKKIETDYALMVYVFHYLDDPKSFLSELKKSIRPGGKLFIANAQLSSVIIRDYLALAGFSEFEEEAFSFSQGGGCGPVQVQLISATNPLNVN